MMKFTIGYHCQQKPAEIQSFLTWINSLKADELELIVVDDRKDKSNMETLNNFPFDSHVQLKVLAFSLEGKANAYNHMIYQAKHPMIMFVSSQHRFEWPDIQDMLKLAEDTDADIVVSPIRAEGLPWHQRRAYPKAFNQARSIFDDPSLLASFTDTIFAKIYRTSFLKKNKVHFLEFNTMLGIPFLSQAFAYKAKIAYAHWLSLTLGEEVFEQGHKDIFKALDRIMQLYKRLHIDDLFAKELNYLILRKIIVNNVLVSRELSKDERKLLTKQCKNYIKRRGVIWDNPYFAADDKWLRLNLLYAKMILS
jgi:hypothetical protein